MKTPSNTRATLGIMSSKPTPPGAGRRQVARPPQKVVTRGADRVVDEPAFRGESLGARSTVVGFHVVGVQTVEEFPDRPLGSEHVKGHMLPMLRNDLVFALRF